MDSNIIKFLNIEDANIIISNIITNGPIEGYNRTPKDFKRNSRELDNFEYAVAG